MHSSSGRATRASRVALARGAEAKSPRLDFSLGTRDWQKVYLKISPPTQTITTGMTNDTKQTLYCFVQKIAKWPTPVR